MIMSVVKRNSMKGGMQTVVIERAERTGLFCIFICLLICQVKAC